MAAAPRVQRAFVWAWLPGRTEPIVVGALDVVGPQLTFTYGRSYLVREDAVSLYGPELPLRRGRHVPPPDLEAAGVIRDAAPDAWGQRVIHRGLAGGAGDTELPLLTYLLESGSDRVGALDFQTSPTEYRPRYHFATLEELLHATERFEAGEVLSEPLAAALLHGTSIGGARPKAALVADGRRLIAKFSSSTDTYPVVKAEAVAMDLAGRAGLSVAPTELVQVMGQDVLLVERFDRTPDGGRRAFVSALTILGLHEISGRYATYFDLADVIRESFTERADTLRELFGRITFNILVGNTDDHARNHAAFWDGEQLTLTPAYDICPQLRAGGEAAQAMAVSRDGFRLAQLAGCVRAAREYELTTAQAREIIDHQIDVVRHCWTEVADTARLSAGERDELWGRQTLNPYAFYDY